MPRWSSIWVLAALVSVPLAGCLGDESDPKGAAAGAPSYVFPADYEIPGTSRSSRDDTQATFRWRNIATPWVGTIGWLAPIGTGPSFSLSVPAPEAVPLLVDFELRYPSEPAQGAPSTDPYVRMVVEDERAEDPCAPFWEYLDAGDHSTHCLFTIDPVPDPVAWQITVDVLYNIRHAVPVDVIIRFLVFEPKEVPITESPLTPEPHVVVGITDSGVNPYHEVYHRPERTMHPCTYVEGFPCEVPALRLSIGLYDDWRTALAADADEWKSVEPGTWYWIPRTALIAVQCSEESRWRPACILDPDGHGTGTSSIVLDENPDALLVVNQGEFADHQAVNHAPFPVDMHSLSWWVERGWVYTDGGLRIKDCQSKVNGHYADPGELIFLSAGNNPTTTLLDCLSGDPKVVTVGGATAGGTENPFTRKTAEVVSWTCRPYAFRSTYDRMTAGCGTSFAAPTVAGAMSKVLLDVRRRSGYTGTTVAGVADPILGIRDHDLREALNLTASYAPDPKYKQDSMCISPTKVCAPVAGIPLNDAAPWLQWGWGFYDNTLVDDTLAHLLGEKTATKQAGAVQWMELQHRIKDELWGS